MTTDDELRARLQASADRAGAGFDPAAMAQRVAAARPPRGRGSGRRGAGRRGGPPWRLFAGLGLVGALVGVLLGATVWRADDNRPASTSAPATSGTPTTGPTGTTTDPTATPTTVTAASTIPVTTAQAPPTTVVTPVTIVPNPTVPNPTVPTTTAAADNVAPNVQASTNRSTIYDASWPECDNEAVLTATANDNVGVVGVTATWTGVPGSPVGFTKGAGSTWTVTFGPFNGLPSSFDAPITVTVTARDAAGNTRSTAVVVEVVGTCLI